MIQTISREMTGARLLRIWHVRPDALSVLLFVFHTTGVVWDDIVCTTPLMGPLRGRNQFTFGGFWFLLLSGHIESVVHLIWRRAVSNISQLFRSCVGQSLMPRVNSLDNVEVWYQVATPPWWDTQEGESKTFKKWIDSAPRVSHQGAWHIRFHPVSGKPREGFFCLNRII